MITWWINNKRIRRQRLAWALTTNIPRPQVILQCKILRSPMAIIFSLGWIEILWTPDSLGHFRKKSPISRLTAQVKGLSQESKINKTSRKNLSRIRSIENLHRLQCRTVGSTECKTFYNAYFMCMECFEWMNLCNIRQNIHPSFRFFFVWLIWLESAAVYFFPVLVALLLF